MITKTSSEGNGESRRPDNGTHLFAAIADDDVEMVGKLVSTEPLLAEERDRRGISAVRRAAQTGDPAMVEAIADVEPQVDVFDVAAVGAVDLVSEILETEPDLTDAFSPDGFTALHIACSFGHTKIVSALLTRGADPEAVSHNGLALRPLHSAINHDALNVVHLLLDRGADVNGRMTRGVTPLHGAAHQGNLAVAEALLLRGADPTATTDDGRHPVDVANGHAGIVALLEG